MQVTTIVLSVIVFFMSIAEVAIETCGEEREYDENDDYYIDNNSDYYDLYNSTTLCTCHESWGVGIWCSIVVSYF